MRELTRRCFFGFLAMLGISLKTAQSRPLKVVITVTGNRARDIIEELGKKDINFGLTFSYSYPYSTGGGSKERKWIRSGQLFLFNSDRKKGDWDISVQP